MYSASISASISPSPSPSPSTGVDLPTFPAERSESYDPDYVWDGSEWTDDEEELSKDGSRHHTQFVCIGMDLIYYEELT